MMASSHLDTAAGHRLTMLLAAATILVAALRAGMPGDAAIAFVAAAALGMLALNAPWQGGAVRWPWQTDRRWRRPPRIVADRRPMLRRAVLVVPPSRRGPRIVGRVVRRTRLEGRLDMRSRIAPRRSARIVRAVSSMRHRDLPA